MFQQGVGPNEKIKCIEPSVENLPELKNNIRINRFSNVELHEVAIGMENGSTGLRNGINSGVVSAGHGTYTVPLRRLESLIREKVDFIKIDVEGYEGQGCPGGVAGD